MQAENLNLKPSQQFNLWLPMSSIFLTLASFYAIFICGFIVIAVFYLALAHASLNARSDYSNTYTEIPFRQLKGIFFRGGINCLFLIFPYVCIEIQ